MEGRVSGPHSCAEYEIPDRVGWVGALVHCGFGGSGAGSALVWLRVGLGFGVEGEASRFRAFTLPPPPPAWFMAGL